MVRGTVVTVQSDVVNFYAERIYKATIRYERIFRGSKLYENSIKKINIFSINIRMFGIQW